MFLFFFRENIVLNAYKAINTKTWTSSSQTDKFIGTSARLNEDRKRFWKEKNQVVLREYKKFIKYLIRIFENIWCNKKDLKR